MPVVERYEPEEIAALRDTFAEMKHNVAMLGVIAFTSMFESHPESQKVFKQFDTVSTADLKMNHELQQHGVRVFHILEKCIGRLEHPEQYRAIVSDLATRHSSYGAITEYVPVLANGFLEAIKDDVSNKQVWTPTAEKAWKKLMGDVTFVMQDGMRSY